VGFGWQKGGNRWGLGGKKHEIGGVWVAKNTPFLQNRWGLGGKNDFFYFMSGNAGKNLICSAPLYSSILSLL